MGPGAFDRAVLDAFVQWRTPALTIPLEAMGRAGTNPGVLLAVMVVGLVLVVALRAFRAGAAVGIAVVAAFGVAKVAKDVFDRPRPDEHLQVVVGQGYAFPSTHGAFTAAAAAAFVTVVAWRSERHRRVVTAVLMAAVVFVGVAMVYLGSHWALDVFAGWAIGLPIGVVVGRALRPSVPERPAPV